MADYWKSLPKKYCDFCKCWITDNKASRDFHERGFRHQANVRRRVHETQKNCTIQERERQKYQNEMLKIEAAALKSFRDNDVKRDPSFKSEYITTKSTTSQIHKSTDNNNATTKRITSTNRFGEDYGDNDNESQKLLNGKQKALETIAKSFEKKSKWLEAKTSDGESYYWNKETMETRKEPPKSGYLTLQEQQQLQITTQQQSTSSSSSSNDCIKIDKYRIDPYGGWQTVDKYDTTKIIDLQLPGQNITEIITDIEKCKQNEEEQQQNKRTEIQFEERRISNIKKSKNDSTTAIGFKKRKSIKQNRNIRNRIDDD